jgi:hypothetical protein
MFGNKDLDYEILYKLDDYDLGNMCKVNKYMKELCKSDIFWLNRTVKKFLPIFKTLVEMKEYKNHYQNDCNFSNWKSYYIDLIKFMKVCYQGNHISFFRKDHYLIFFNIKQQTENLYRKILDFLNNETFKGFTELENQEFKNWLKGDFIHLNSLFQGIINNDKKKVRLSILLTFFEISNFSINEYSVNSFLEFYKKKGAKMLLKRKNNEKIRKKILYDILDCKKHREDYVVFNYIESFSEILDVLFERIQCNIYENKIKLLLDKAVEKGALRKDLTKYYRKNKDNVTSMYYKDQYKSNLKIVKKYTYSLKELTPLNSKRRKIY